MVGLTREKPGRVLRGAKTIFFLLTMSFSLLLFSLPILLLLADALLPAALFSNTLSTTPLSDQLRSYDFQHSLIDVPIISLVRSAAILLVYYLCDGPGLSRAPYLAVTTVCSLLSLVVVGMKACVFWERLGGWEGWAEEALFLSSVALAVAHVVAAYRISCRERRKLLVYKIDVEAVSAVFLLVICSFYSPPSLC